MRGFIDDAGVDPLDRRAGKSQSAFMRGFIDDQKRKEVRKSMTVYVIHPLWVATDADCRCFGIRVFPVPTATWPPAAS